MPIDIPSFADLFEVARNEALRRNGRLRADVIDREGTDANILVAAGVAAADEIAATLEALAASTFLDSAGGQDLDRLVFDRYGIIRKPAAPATGTANFTATPAPVIAFTIAAGTVLASTTGQQYITLQTGTFTIGQTTIGVPIRSTLAGVDQQAKIGTITSILSAAPAPPGVALTVNNLLATSGADDAEDDACLRSRARAFFTTARRGTLAAIETGALAVPGVRTAKAIEILDTFGRPARIVQLVITDAFTEALIDLDPSSPSGIRYNQQSQQLAVTVFAALDDVRAAGIFVDVFVANVVFLPVLLSLRFFANTNADAVAQQARAVMVGYINALRPGDDFIPTTAVEILRGVPGLDFTGQEILSPPGTVIAAPLEVLRATLSVVLASSAQTDRPLVQSSNPDDFLPV